MFVLFIVFLFASVPIFASISAAVAIVFAVFHAGTPMPAMLAQAVVTSMDSFALMAIPFFMLVGSLMQRTGIAGRLVDVAKMITSDKPGGLGMTAVVASVFFAAISGSGPATAAAIGAIMVPAMTPQGYPKDYSAALVGASSTFGPVLPPSIPMIMYGVTVGVSITALFTAGFLPGFMMAAALVTANYVISKKRGYKGEVITYTRKERLLILRNALWAMLMPIVVLGGIYTGVFTPTESAVIGVVYSIVVGRFAYRTLNWKMFKESLIEAAITSATIMILFGGAITFGRLLAIAQIPQAISAGLLSISESPLVILLLVNLVVLFIGMFLDTISCIIILAPILAPLMESLGFSPVFFGAIMVINLCMGMITPPVAANLFVVMRISKSTFEGVLKEAWPFMLVLFSLLIVFIIFPQIILFLPQLFGLIR